MRRRAFLRGGLGTAGAVATAGALAAGAGVAVASAATDDPHDPEEQHFAGMGGGSAELVWSFDIERRAVALTFDDGPHPELTPRILDVLATRGVRATFFLLGESCEAHPQLARRLVDAGHEIGNHTWSHLSLAHATGAEARAEILDGAAAIERVTGRAPSWFRPPRGMVNGAVVRAAADLGQHVAMWTAKPPKTGLDDADQVAGAIAEALAPGAILLFHDGTSGREDDELEARRRLEVPVLERLLDRIEAAGYELATIGELAAART